MDRLVPYRRVSAQEQRVAAQRQGGREQGYQIGDEDPGHRPAALAPTVNARRAHDPHRHAPTEQQRRRPAQPAGDMLPGIGNAAQPMRRRHRRPQQYRAISDAEHDHRNQRPPVTHPHPMVGERPRQAPADPVPAGKGDAGHPPRLLPDRGLKRLGEIGPHGDEASIVRVPYPREADAAAAAGDMEAEFVLSRAHSNLDLS